MKVIIKKINDVVQKILYILSSEQKKFGIMVFVASVVGSTLEMIGVSAILPMINVLLTPEELLKNNFIKFIFELFYIQTREEMVIAIVALVIMIYIFKNMYFIFLSWVRAKYANKVKREISLQAMNSYMNSGYSFFLTKNTSEFLRGVLVDTSAVYAVLDYLFKILADCTTIILICVYMLLTDWVMAVAMMVLSALCILIIGGYFKEKMQKIGMQSRKYKAVANQEALQVFHGIKEITVMRKQKKFVERFEDALLKQNKADVANAVGLESPAYIIEGICITGLLIVVAVRIVLGGEDAGAMLPVLSTFAVGAFRILPSLGKLSSGANGIAFYLPSLNSMYTQMQEERNRNKETFDFDVLKNISTDTEDKELKLKKELRVEQVYWKYESSHEYILKSINLTVNKGESIALIGQSGAGKTTLADIMLGLLHPQKGQVTLDGRDIFTIGKEWRNIMGYVPQSVYLTDDSLRRNIAFGVDDKDIDDERIWKALEQAQLKEFVEHLDKKLDTLVGERGVRFSGGQRQRVAIARALYENPDILILDEATAALDNETEEAVMESIEALQGNVTLIIIAHRLSTIRKCDKIYEVKDGGIVERDKDALFS